MRTVSARVSSCALALLLLSCVTVSDHPTPPARTGTVPATAIWAGGVDGGAWIECRPEGALSYHCVVWNDFTGERTAEGRFLLRTVTWDEANARASYAPPSTTPEALVHEGFDGTILFLADGLALVPDGYLSYPAVGKRQLFEEGRALAEEETVARPMDGAP